jgi:small subunit ribosomal protein S1
LQQNPWYEHVKSLKKGQLVEAEITRLTSFGAFAKLLNVPGELEGLIHISELSEDRVDHPKQVVKSGEVLTLRILNIEEGDQRIGLSRRRVDSPAYADMDWKSLVASYNLSAAGDGETIGDFVEESVEEEVVADETPVEESTETAAEEVAEEVVEEAEEAVEETAEDADKE